MPVGYLLTQGLGNFGGGGCPSPPGAATLAVVDDADGTGATATISGSSAGITNSVYTSVWTPASGALSFSLAGSRDGNGTVALNLTDGVYVAYVVSTASGLSTLGNFVTFQTTGTSPVSCIHYGLLEALETTLRALVAGGTLVGIAQASILHRKTPGYIDFVNSGAGAGQYNYPGILISPSPQTETFDPTGNNAEDWSFPCLIVIVANDNRTIDASENPYLRWRQKIIDKFIGPEAVNKTYSIADPVTQFHDVRVEPGPIIDWERWWGEGKYVSSFVLRFSTQRTRANA